MRAVYNINIANKRRKLNNNGVAKPVFSKSLDSFAEIASKVNLISQDSKEVLNRLKKALTTNILDLSEIRLKFEDIKEYIIPFLARNPNIKELNVCNCGLDRNSCELIAEDLKLDKLNIGQNVVGDKGILLLAKNKYLTDLRVSYAHFNNKDEACEAFRDNKNLKKLDINHNFISDKGIIALSKNKYITHLNISTNDIVEIGEDAAKSVAENKSIICLDLSGNKITENSAKILSKNTNIQEIIVCICEIDDNCITHLSQNKNIKKLHISHNNITDVGALLLSNIILSDVDIAYNTCTISGIKSLIENKNITNLDISGNSFSLEERRELLVSHKNFFDNKNIMILHNEDILTEEEHAELERQNNIKCNPF